MLTLNCCAMIYSGGVGQDADSSSFRLFSGRDMR